MGFASFTELSSERTCAEQRLFQNSAWLHLSLWALGSVCAWGECWIKPHLYSASWIVHFERARRVSSRNRTLLWAGGSSEAAFPPGIASNALSLRKTLFCCRLLLFSPFLPHIQAGTESFQQYLIQAHQCSVGILGSVQTHGFVSAVMLLKTATF